MWKLLAVILVLAGPAAAQDWQRLNDAGLTEILTSHDLIYEDGATQEFLPSGLTRYTFGEPSWGNWRARGGQYCSQWPPGPDWDCYDVDHDGGARVRFTDEWGNETVGTYLE